MFACLSLTISMQKPVADESGAMPAAGGPRVRWRAACDQRCAERRRVPSPLCLQNNTQVFQPGTVKPGSSAVRLQDWG